jgi:hypothetical protein
LVNFLRAVLHIERSPVDAKDKEVIYINYKPRHLSRATSREIRLSRADNEPICVFKGGPILTPRESINYFYNLNKLSSVKHKNIILRIIHGEIYTSDRLHKFGLVDSPSCTRCDQTETIEHRFVSCEYVDRIWADCYRRTGKAVFNLDPIQDRILASENLDQLTLTLHAELLLRISYLSRNPEYLVHPKIFVSNAIKYLIKMEKSRSIKESLEDLL